jgi:hypothetical protein
MLAVDPADFRNLCLIRNSLSLILQNPRLKNEILEKDPLK